MKVVSQYAIAWALMGATILVALGIWRLVVRDPLVSLVGQGTPSAIALSTLTIFITYYLTYLPLSWLFRRLTHRPIGLYDWLMSLHRQVAERRGRGAQK